MRFLHTADWHIGRQLRGRSRTAEQEAFLQEILDIASNEKIDLLLVAGDVFDSHAPPPDAERMVYQFFAELVGRKIPAVVIGGNHDHPKRLAAVRPMLDSLSIFIRPELKRSDDGGVFEFHVREETAQIALIPWIPETKIVEACELLGPEEKWYSTYNERVVQIIGLLSAGFSPETINIIAGHVFVYGAETSGSERHVHVAHPFAVPPQRFPASAQYVALGHLHRPQRVEGPAPIHYCGSPLQLDFGEQGQQKSVMIVEVRANEPAAITEIPLTTGRRLRSVLGTIEELTRDADSYGGDFLRVTVRTDGPMPGLAAQVRDLLTNALDVQLDYPRMKAGPPEASVRTLSPEELFSRYYEATHGSPASAPLMETFRQLYTDAHDASD